MVGRNWLTKRSGHHFTGYFNFEYYPPLHPINLCIRVGWCSGTPSGPFSQVESRQLGHMPHSRQEKAGSNPVRPVNHIHSRWCCSHSLTKAYSDNHGFFPLFPVVDIHGRGYMSQDVILVVVSANEVWVWVFQTSNWVTLCKNTPSVIIRVIASGCIHWNDLKKKKKNKPSDPVGQSESIHLTSSRPK